MRLSNMLKDVGMVSERSRAELAVVRPLPRMDVHVVLVAKLVDESLLADGTVEGHVGIGRVVLQYVLVQLAFVALLAAVLAGHDDVYPAEVGIEVLLALEHLTTLGTLKLGRLGHGTDPLVVAVTLLLDTFPTFLTVDDFAAGFHPCPVSTVSCLFMFPQVGQSLETTATLPTNEVPGIFVRYLVVSQLATGGKHLVAPVTLQLFQMHRLHVFDDALFGEEDLFAHGARLPQGRVIVLQVYSDIDKVVFNFFETDGAGDVLALGVMLDRMLGSAHPADCLVIAHLELGVEVIDSAKAARELKHSIVTLV